MRQKHTRRLVDEMLNLLSKDLSLMTRKHPSFHDNDHNLNCALLIFRSQGGVKFVSGTGRITLDNTMEERLRLLEDKVTFFFLFCWRTNLLIHIPFVRCYQRLGKSCLGRTQTVNSSHNDSP